MTEAELALERAKKLAFLMTERFSMNPISTKLLNEAWRLAFPDEVAVARRMRAMVEALEKAQHTITEMDNRIRQQNRNVCELFDDGKALREQIAELESRTVTDWIEHDGKWRPDSLSTDELVYLKTRKQELKIPYPAGKVLGWMHTGGDMDVMAYKLASPQARTVTVKLPDIMPPEAAPAHYWGSGESMAYADGYNKSAADLKTSFAQACSSAGVNVEFE